MIEQLKVRLSDDEIMGAVADVVFGDPALFPPAQFEVVTTVLEVDPSTPGEKQVEVNIRPKSGEATTIREAKTVLADDVSLALVGAAVFNSSAALDPTVYELVAVTLAGNAGTDKTILFDIKPKAV